jgi:hypothetical protein
MPRLALITLAFLTITPAIAAAEQLLVVIFGGEDSPKPEPVYWGIGGEVRRTHVSTGVQHFFVEDTPGPATQDGAGIAFTRRQGRNELVLGFGYDPFEGQEGYYLELDQDPTGFDNVDLVEFSRKLSWFTIDFTIVGHINLHKILALRYGAGLGVGIIRGTVWRTSATCTSDRIQQDCELDETGARQHEAAKIPPVLPVVNFLAGIELRPAKFFAVHVDAGLHTVPYVGAGVTLYLW